MNKAPKKTTVILALVLMTTFSAPCNGIDSEEWIAQTFCGAIIFGRKGICFTETVGRIAEDAIKNYVKNQ